MNIKACLLILMVFVMPLSGYQGPTELHHIAIDFLQTFNEEEYQVIAHNLARFEIYEEFLESISNMQLDSMGEYASCFAQSLSKGANIYRRIASLESLQLALKYHQRVLEIKKHYNHKSVEIAHTLADIGATHNELKGKENNVQAIEYYQQALNIYRNIGDNRYIASTLNKLANALRDLDIENISVAIKYHHEALSLFQQLTADEDNLREIGKILYNQGINHYRLGTSHFGKALEYFGKAQDVFEQINDQARVEKTLHYLELVQAEFNTLKE